MKTRQEYVRVNNDKEICMFEFQISRRGLLFTMGGALGVATVGAARLYATPHIFLRPAVDVHWVNNFFQFGSNWVPEYTMGVGYSFGGEK